MIWQKITFILYKIRNESQQMNIVSIINETDSIGGIQKVPIAILEIRNRRPADDSRFWPNKKYTH